MRSFIKKFHIKLSKKKREQLKANSEKAKVVVRKRKPDGSFTVSCPQLFHPSFKHIQNLCRTFPVGWNSSNNTFGFTMFFFSHGGKGSKQIPRQRIQMTNPTGAQPAEEWRAWP